MAQRRLPSWREMRAYAIAVISSDFFFSTERLPCRILDALFCLWQLDPGMRGSVFLLERMVGRERRASSPAGWNTASEYHTYTHSIFFRTNSLDSAGMALTARIREERMRLSSGLSDFFPKKTSI